MLQNSCPRSQILLANSGKWGHYHTDNRPMWADHLFWGERYPPVSRLRKPYYVQQKVSIPATLLARFSRFHWDATLGKVQYGAISAVVTDLLSDYVNRMENSPPIAPVQEPDKENQTND